MTPDHYATLGLAPNAPDVVVRAAYVAMVQLYHPDRNPAAGAAARTRAINDAYAVLGDAERRAEYDQRRLAAGRVLPPPPRSRSSALFAAAAITVLALAALLYLRSPLQSPQAPFGLPWTGDELAELEPGPPPATLDPQSPLRRPGSESAGDQPPAAAPLPLPPPMARVASRPAPEPVPPAARATANPAPAKPAAAPAPGAPAAPPPPRVAAQPPPSPPRPSFSCRFARTRGEIAVCRNASLASLDRQQAILYSQSWALADAAKRTQLLRSHRRFVARRDNCRSDSCTSGVYLARLREVSTIMMDR